jgi:hypothetical protein
MAFVVGSCSGMRGRDARGHCELWRVLVEFGGASGRDRLIWTCIGLQLPRLDEQFFVS